MIIYTKSFECEGNPDLNGNGLEINLLPKEVEKIRNELELSVEEFVKVLIKINNIDLSQFSMPIIVKPMIKGQISRIKNKLREEGG